MGTRRRADMSEPDRGYRPKLIETPIPVTEISKASLADKNRKVGTIKNLHKWFAPMPTPALRAVIFCALVNEPENPDERRELIEFVKELVPEEGIPSADVLRRATDMIKADNPELPVVFDPFAGSGSTLVEAQRLGLPVVGSDYNPIAALIARALTELLPPLVEVPAIRSERDDARLQDDMHKPFEGLAADVRHYGALVHRAVQDELGQSYPAAPNGAPVAWLWARTVPCPNPSCPVTVPLFSSPRLSKQKGRETSVSAVADDHQVKIVLHHGPAGAGKATKIGGRAQFACPRCGEPFGEREIRAAGKDDKLGLQLLAMCVDTDAGRTFLSPDEVPPFNDDPVVPDDLDELELGDNTRDFRTGLYGLTHHADLYTTRQLAMLAAFADKIATIPAQVLADGGGEDRARAITTLLGLSLGKLAQSNSALVRWFIDPRNGAPKAVQAFGTQAIPMLWDFAEAYPFGKSVGSWKAQLDSVIGALGSVPRQRSTGRVLQADARNSDSVVLPGSALVVTDPPYFGQINYADLSDYFYLWLRRALREVHPDLFGTMASPKSGELTANPARHAGSADAARKYFIDGFTEVFTNLQKASRSDLPMLVVYAHKQDEREEDGLISTGWEALLEAVLLSGLSVVGTWPVEASSLTKMIAQGANSLSSYVILVCRPRPTTATATDRRGFIAELREKLPPELRSLQQAGIAPVDVAQAAIGPGMAVFSRHARVNEPDGTAMSVRVALKLINDVVAAAQSEQVGDVSQDSRWCLEWFSTYGFESGPFGKADQLARSKDTSVASLQRAGVLRSGGNKVRLLTVEELAPDYDPMRAERVSEWQVALHLAKRLRERGSDETARLMAVARSAVDLDAVQELIYLLYSIANDKRWADTALLFNGLGTSWSDLSQASRRPGVASGESQDELGLDFHQGGNDGDE
jgi:putative DNA methylase